LQPFPGVESLRGFKCFGKFLGSAAISPAAAAGAATLQIDSYRLLLGFTNYSSYSPGRRRPSKAASFDTFECVQKNKAWREVIVNRKAVRKAVQDGKSTKSKHHLELLP
jgi:hypothetical protein